MDRPPPGAQNVAPNDSWAADHDLIALPSSA
jgi:hypothetical protein